MATQYAISGTTAKGIAESVERAVADGSLPPGGALPPVRRLAEDLGVSPGTVATAYKELRRRGIVLTRGRGGTVIAEAPSVGTSGSRRPPKTPEGVRSLAGGHPDPAFLPDLMPPSRVTPGPGSHRTSPRLPELEAVARRWFERDGVPAGHVTFAHGALDCVGRLLSAELRPGDAVAMEDPGFHRLLDLAPALGLRILPVAVDEEGMRPEALRSALRAGARAVVCMPRSQSPLGACFSERRRADLLAVLTAAPEVLVIEDDYTADTSGVALHSLTTGGLPRWAQVRTVSKHLGSDLRWAALACDGTSLARHDGLLLLTSGWVSHVLQETVLRLLTDPATAALVARAEAAYTARREALIGELGRRGITAYGRSGLNVWVPVRDESAVVNGLRSYGWWVAGGARFRTASAPGVRITTAGLAVEEAPRLADDFAAVLGESESTYGG